MGGSWYATQVSSPSAALTVVTALVRRPTSPSTFTHIQGRSLTAVGSMGELQPLSQPQTPCGLSQAPGTTSGHEPPSPPSARAERKPQVLYVPTTTSLSSSCPSTSDWCFHPVQSPASNHVHLSQTPPLTPSFNLPDASIFSPQYLSALPPSSSTHPFPSSSSASGTPAESGLQVHPPWWTRSGNGCQVYLFWAWEQFPSQWQASPYRWAALCLLWVWEAHHPELLSDPAEKDPFSGKATLGCGVWLWVQSACPPDQPPSKCTQGNGCLQYQCLQCGKAVRQRSNLARWTHVVWP